MNQYSVDDPYKNVSDDVADCSSENNYDSDIYDSNAKFNITDTSHYDLSCFKSYDIRGKVPEQFNEELAYKIGLAYVQIFSPGQVVVGRDVRIESQSLANAVISGLRDAGSDVVDIGLCGTEEVYFHCFNGEAAGVGGGIMVTASHNPIGYNGLKMVSKGSKPIFAERGLNQIKQIIENNNFQGVAKHKGNMIADHNKSSYIEHLLNYINLLKLESLKIVVNPGNGPAGQIVRLLEKKLPFEFVFIHEEPDGTFPNGVPNPILKENQQSTSEAVIRHGANFGVAWDGDFDRCFFFDEYGAFIEGYYVVGLLSEVLLNNTRGESIIHDPRLIWNTMDIAESHAAISVQSKTGHSFMKDAMRSANAIYGGEMSAHHYFRDFAYCDSGMIPWLLVAELLSTEKKALSSIIDNRKKLYPCSGEINFRVNDSEVIINKILEYYSDQSPKIDKLDGISLEFDNWRFNLRRSNTEPLLRLNVETRGDESKLNKEIAHLKSLILT